MLFSLHKSIFIYVDVAFEDSSSYIECPDFSHVLPLPLVQLPLDLPYPSRDVLPLTQYSSTASILPSTNDLPIAFQKSTQSSHNLILFIIFFELPWFIFTYYNFFPHCLSFLFLKPSLRLYLIQAKERQWLVFMILMAHGVCSPYSLASLLDYLQVYIAKVGADCIP